MSLHVLGHLPEMRRGLLGGRRPARGDPARRREPRATERSPGARVSAASRSGRRPARRRPGAIRCAGRCVARRPGAGAGADPALRTLGALPPTPRPLRTTNVKIIHRNDSVHTPRTRDAAVAPAAAHQPLADRGRRRAHRSPHRRRGQRLPRTQRSQRSHRTGAPARQAQAARGSGRRRRNTRPDDAGNRHPAGQRPLKLPRPKRRRPPKRRPNRARKRRPHRRPRKKRRRPKCTKPRRRPKNPRNPSSPAAPSGRPLSGGRPRRSRGHPATGNASPGVRFPRAASPGADPLAPRTC